ncbi:MAG TPA: hypothetical protein VH682_00880 [Gemmataceae bacterium]
MAKDVVLLVIDDYQRNINRKKEFPHPSWSEIDCAVQGLDNQGRSSMAICNGDEDVLAIGGGEPLYHVSLTTGRQSFVLTNGSADHQLIEVIIGGVETPLPANYLVSRETALAAAQSFWSGTLNVESQEWLEV